MVEIKAITRLETYKSVREIFWTNDFFTKMTQKGNVVSLYLLFLVTDKYDECLK